MTDTENLKKTRVAIGFDKDADDYVVDLECRTGVRFRRKVMFSHNAIQCDCCGKGISEKVSLVPMLTGHYDNEATMSACLFVTEIFDGSYKLCEGCSEELCELVEGYVNNHERA